MFNVYTRIIGLAAVLAALGPASVAAASSGPTQEAVAALRTAAGLDPYDTSKDTHVMTAAPSGPTWEAMAALRTAAGLDPYDTSKDTHVMTAKNGGPRARSARQRGSRRHHAGRSRQAR